MTKILLIVFVVISSTDTKRKNNQFLSEIQKVNKHLKLRRNIDFKGKELRSSCWLSMKKVLISYSCDSAAVTFRAQQKDTLYFVDRIAIAV